jgi:GntR family transcriptional regulator
MLKRNPSLTEQAKSYIKQRIVADEFVAGRIPSETDLANELGVSRTTIRDALSRLELEGVIFRKQGAGTFVNAASLQLKTRLEEIWYYEAMLEAHGYVPTTRIIGIEEQSIDAGVAADLRIPTSSTVLLIKKLFLADGQPVIFTQNYIPTNLIATTYREDIFHQPVYRFLADLCQQHLSYYLSEIVPLVSPAWLSELLNIKRRTALISFEETGFNQENLPILKARSYFRDDLLRLRLMRREA